MNRFLLIVVICSSVLFGATNPKSSKFDNRIKFAKYNADDVFSINCKNGFVSMLEFSSDERIINIATGFSDGWELIDRENFLFIKPKTYIVKQEEQSMADENGETVDMQSAAMAIQPNKEDWKTNLIVTTTKRIYVFDLELLEDKDKEVNYKTEFSYPDEVKQKTKQQEEFKHKLELDQQNKEKLEIELNKTTIPRNWDFMMHVNKGSETISPDFAYDDGVFTYLGFNNTKTIPSVFLYEFVGGEPKESILNTHLKKDGNYDVLVVHKTAKRILLRSGNKLVGIQNDGYAKNPLPKTYETNSKSVKREIIVNE